MPSMLSALLVAFLSAQSADMASTAWRLQHGYVEANRFMPASLPRIVTVKAVYVGGSVVVAWRWRKQHPKLAMAVLVPGIAVGTWAAVHNARVR